MFGLEDKKDEGKEVEVKHEDVKHGEEKHDEKVGMAKVREDKKEDKKEEDDKEHGLAADKKAKEATKKFEEKAKAEKEDTAHIHTGDSSCDRHLLPEVPVQVVTCDETKVTKAMPFVDTEHDKDRAVKVEDQK